MSNARRQPTTSMKTRVPFWGDKASDTLLPLTEDGLYFIVPSLLDSNHRVPTKSLKKGMWLGIKVWIDS